MSDDNVQNPLGLPDEFTVAPLDVDVATQQEYVAYAAELRADDYSSEDLEAQTQRLFSADTTKEEKKETLALLAHTGKLRSATTIRQFLEMGEPELRDWAKMSLQECQLFADDVWVGDDGTGVVITGLGGDGNRLRYFAAIRSKLPDPYTGVDRAVIAQAFADVCDEFNAVLDDLQIKTTHIELKLLIPLDVAVGEVIAVGIKACNRERSLTDENYYVTNVKIPTEEELQSFLENRE